MASKNKYPIKNHVKQRKAEKLEPAISEELFHPNDKLSFTELEVVVVNSRQIHLNNDVPPCMTPSLPVSVHQVVYAPTSQNLTSTCLQSYFMLQVLGVMGAELGLEWG